MSLRPGEQADLTVKIDLTHRQQYQLGLARWDVSVWINPVFAGDFAPTPGWELKGVVLSRVSLEAASLSFGDQCVHGGPPVMRKVRVVAHTRNRSRGEGDRRTVIREYSLVFRGFHGTGSFAGKQYSSRPTVRSSG